MTEPALEILVESGGKMMCIYSEAVDLAQLGDVQIRRASHCEPDAHGQWWADLAPMSGPNLGPFTCRSAALAAEVQWLRRVVLRMDAAKEVTCESFGS
jgi:hypothetical protein